MASVVASDGDNCFQEISGTKTCKAGSIAVIAVEIKIKMVTFYM